MNTALFTSFPEVLAGLFVGLFFGFFLQKAHVTRFSTIVGQLILKDFTVMKVIMTAIACGSLGLYLLKLFFPEIELIISSTTLLAAALGGGIFGIGMAILGYCPGTCVGALAEKTKDARFGILGMILGAALYAEIYPWIHNTLKPACLITKVTLPEYFQLSPWLFIALCGSVVAVFILCDKKRK